MSHSDNTPSPQKMSQLLGVIVIARNGDRQEYYQDPKNYNGAPTETTALGEVCLDFLSLQNNRLTVLFQVESHQLGAFLRSTYLDSGSPSFIKGISTDLVDNSEVKVRVKAGGEGTVVFDSAIALLQGLFPPTSKNRITLANSTVVTAPLGGYQYVPVETVEPGNDRSLESWTDCPNFQKHIADFYNSAEFKQVARDAQPFFSGVRDYIFGRTANLENIWNVYDFMNSQLTHNKTYAHRLPPTFIEQARGLVDFHENGIFSDKEIAGPGNIAGRTILHTIVNSLERVAFNGDPLQFMLIETTYQPFISLFHQTDIVKIHPELKGVPNYASALAFELRRGSPPDTRDFLRVRFKNGTASDFETVHVFEHHADIPLTEFIYRIESSAISSNKQWAQACGADYFNLLESATGHAAPSLCFSALALVMLLGFGMLFKFVRRSRTQARLRLEGDETPLPTQEKARLL
jgi:lysosomal acid phosphatase